MNNRKMMYLVVALTALCGNTLGGYWSTPVLISELNPTGSTTAVAPALSGDGLTIYYNLPESEPLWSAQRASRSEPFSGMAPINELHNGTHAGGPYVTADNLHLYYQEYLANGEQVIRMAARPDVNQQWTLAETFTDIHSLGYGDWQPTLTADELTMVWGSNRGSGECTLWMATRASIDAPFSTPAHLSELAGGSEEAGPSISADGLTLYYHTVAADGYAGDIYMGTRPDLNSAFGNFQPLTGVNSTVFNEQHPWVSADGTEIYFTRRCADGGNEGNGIYYSTYIPEPCTISLLALGALAVAKKHHR